MENKNEIAASQQFEARLRLFLRAILPVISEAAGQVAQSVMQQKWRAKDAIKDLLKRPAPTVAQLRTYGMMLESSWRAEYGLHVLEGACEQILGIEAASVGSDLMHSAKSLLSGEDLDAIVLRDLLNGLAELLSYCMYSLVHISAPADGEFQISTDQAMLQSCPNCWNKPRFLTRWASSSHPRI